MDMGSEFLSLTELVEALDRATLSSKQLPTTTDPFKITQIYATLHSAHFHLSSFLYQSFQTPPQPSIPPPHPSPGEHSSLSSGVGNDEPMLIGDDEDEEEEEESNSKRTIDSVEGRMKDCFLQNKRLKRPLSPAADAAAEQQRRSDEHDSVRGSLGFNPQGTRLRALDLIYQFHG